MYTYIDLFLSDKEREDKNTVNRWLWGVDILNAKINNATDEDGVISRRKLMKSIKNYHTKAVVKDVYNVLEDVIFDVLSSADKKQDVCIKLFEGISLDCKYIPESVKQNNLTGKTSLVESKIKPKFNITRYYCEKLNNNK